MSKGMRAALLWAATGDNGLSSCSVLAATLGEVRGRISYPLDTADLGRCLRLLKAWPRARSGIRRLASACPVWREIDHDWRAIAAAAKAERVAEPVDWHKGSNFPRTRDLLKAAISRGEHAHDHPVATNEKDEVQL